MAPLWQILAAPVPMVPGSPEWGCSPPASLATWLLSPADKLYNTSAPLNGGQASIRRRGLWGTDSSRLWAASGCLCRGGGLGM